MADKKCRECKNVKVLDNAVGRCMKVDGLFCKLDDKTHVCENYKAVNK